MLDMQTIADRRTEGFSQGERMKVCLARALIHSPDNIVLDEPTNGLDVMTTRKVRELINELRQLGLCVLFSSHIMHEVSRLCDEIVIIAEGQVVAQGVPDAIRESAGEENLEDAFVILSERAARL
jgi:sodium transport system ATP-binding protein